jgi:16S rRNA (uracil1498-N3)-methyltransferase
MSARLYVDLPLSQAGQAFELPPGAARHAQVLRLQPGDQLRLFDGRSDRLWTAEVTAMGRSSVAVRLLEAQAVSTELPLAVTLATVMPANDRMDFLVEKATELGAAALQPLMGERSVLRLNAERADKKRGHWQGVAQAAAEQCGRVRLPEIHAVRQLPAWLAGLPPLQPGEARWLASPGAQGLPARGAAQAVTLLTGPEGGLSEAEEQLALAAGFQRISLGPRILRADTAPLALLAFLGLGAV